MSVPLHSTYNRNIALGISMCVKQATTAKKDGACCYVLCSAYTGNSHRYKEDKDTECSVRTYYAGPLKEKICQKIVTPRSRDP